MSVEAPWPFTWDRYATVAVYVGEAGLQAVTGKVENWRVDTYGTVLWMQVSGCHLPGRSILYVREVS